MVSRRQNPPPPSPADRILEGLNDNQREAVTAIDGPLLIIAGPGSGKTRVITHRIAYLVRVVGITPYRIAAVTFTNKAAREMRQRLVPLLGQAAEQLTASTFHAFCANVLRREGEHIGLDRDFVIYDDTDQMALVKRALTELELDPKRFPPRSILSGISSAKSELLGVEGLAHRSGSYWDEIVVRAYERYDDLLRQCSAVDFDDLLLKTYQLFDRVPDVAQKYQERYVHFMIDEFQDTNVAQYAIAKQLARHHLNICVVGDPDQSIYSWRSADVRNILNFKSDNPRARVISLGQNYRSTSNILNAAKGLIATNGQRLDNDLFTENLAGAPVQLHEAYTDDEEADSVIAEIGRLTREEGFKLGDCAVLYRVNAQSRALEEACLSRGMKYRLVGGTRFYQRREIKDLAAYLRLLHNPQDDVNLSRIINVPPRGIGAKSIQQLGEWAAYREVSLYEGMREIAAAHAAKQPGPAPLPTRAVTSVARFVETIDRLTALSREVEIVKLVDLALEESGLRKHIQDSDDRPEERWENVLAFRDLAQEFNAEMPPDGLGSLLERTALVSQVDEYEEVEDSLTLITLHQAKGLEFPVVFIVGLEEGLLPHSRSMDSEEQLEEERRLCYVGMTRAQQRLYLLRAFRRGFRNGTGGGPAVASRFLREIPENLLASADLGPSRSVSPPMPGRGSSIRAAALAAAAAAPSPTGPALRVGDLVRHRAFGEGVVTAYNPSTSDDEVTVEFAGGVGVKRLLLSFAPLEKLSDQTEGGR
jgi:DNA helicase-2/ATP-dependent DNA helicase PcrA